MEDLLPWSVFDKCRLKERTNAAVLLLSLCFSSSGGEWLHLCVPGYLSTAEVGSTWNPTWVGFTKARQHLKRLCLQGYILDSVLPVQLATV